MKTSNFAEFLVDLAMHELVPGQTVELKDMRITATSETRISLEIGGKTVEYDLYDGPCPTAEATREIVRTDVQLLPEMEI